MMEGGEEENIDLEPVGLGCCLEKFSELDEVLVLISMLERVGDGRGEKRHERLRYILSLYKEQPHLIHPHLSEILGRLVESIKLRGLSNRVGHEAFRYMYLVTNVAGYKVVVRYLPHSASDLQTVVTMLESQDKGDTSTWETRYCLILWLSIVVKIPLDLSRLDYAESSDHVSIAERIITLCKVYLPVRDSCRIAAAVLCAHFFTRRDIKHLHLRSFLEWASRTITDKTLDVDNIGILAAVAAILKLGKREDILPHSSQLLKNIQSLDWKKQPFRLSRKYCVKVIQRIGLTFLKPRVVSWRYQRGCRSIKDNLARIASEEKDKTMVTTERKDEEEECESDETVEVGEEVEEVIEELIEALKDVDLTVRWCAAKGVGRVAGRLDKHLADQVVGSVLELLSPSETENSWHGGCLALAELSKRGLLLPSRLDRVVPLIERALVYDEPRGFSSVGATVRDAACYVAWCFARAYGSGVLEPYVGGLANSLVVVACFDREINIRRAASAAFQEHVGRRGGFPHGIEILTVADYFSVSVRQNCYLNISVSVGRFEEYSTRLIDHLVDKKMGHWDSAIRELASKALHGLTSTAPDYVEGTVVPTLLQETNSIDVNTRHGAILCLGESIHALSLLGINLDGETQSRVCGLVSTLERRHQFRGTNGESMKSCCCHLILKCCLCPNFGCTEVSQEWLRLIDSCLSHEVAGLRVRASAALSALCERIVVNDDSAEKLVAKYTDTEGAKEELVRLGRTLAIGCLPARVLRECSDNVIDRLIEWSRITAETESWVESRKEAVLALRDVYSKLGSGEATCPALRDVHSDSGLRDAGCRARFDETIECLIVGLQDYTVDDRGDTGAWVREASLSALKTILVQGKCVVKVHQVSRCLSLIAGQAVQRIDRTRLLATSVFVTLLHADLPYVPHRTSLLDIFPSAELQPDSWTTAYEMLDKFVLLLSYDAYSYNLLQGFIISVGGLTESLVKNSSKALFGWISKQSLEEQSRICRLIVEIFETNTDKDRIVQPMASFLRLVLSDGCIADVLKSDSEFPPQILALVKKCFSNSTVKFKLCGSIDIYCQMIQVDGSVRRSSLSRLMVLLCHRFGWVRRLTASSLYEALLIYGDVVADQQQVDVVQNLLSETDWAITRIDDLRPIRNRIALTLGIKPPVSVPLRQPSNDNKHSVIHS